MALSEDSIDLCVQEEKLEQYFKVRSLWMPQDFCELHQNDFQRTIREKKRWITVQKCCMDILKYENRTPGLFKTEAEGTR